VKFRFGDEHLYVGRSSGIPRNIGGILMVAKINKDECVACGACVDVCPEGAITIEDVAVVDVKKCLDCGACVDECPNNSITVEEKK
jgi:ferredoxin